MCVYSVMHEYIGNIPATDWTRPMYDDYYELRRKAMEWDKMYGQPNCEELDKVELLKDIDKRLAAIEEKLEKE